MHLYVHADADARGKARQQSAQNMVTVGAWHRHEKMNARKDRTRNTAVSLLQQQVNTVTCAQRKLA